MKYNAYNLAIGRRGEIKKQVHGIKEGESGGCAI